MFYNRSDANAHQRMGWTNMDARVDFIKMENQIKQYVFAGIAGTAVMTMVMFIAQIMMAVMSVPSPEGSMIIL